MNILHDSLQKILRGARIDPDDVKTIERELRRCYAAGYRNAEIKCEEERRTLQRLRERISDLEQQVRLMMSSHDRGA